ncbi:E3 ubiquitin-protein ligase UPL4 [Zea mays]|uniref:E3 ubiquitin-protein ligase UPL4 n=1 Tax=Zea mays TaxID=4577 RepID=UPI0009AAB2A8|nr:E3 ubiquitin-protein ligase UPL4 [Zea mays]|eukprot:XP_020395487.1 E3 ubiquitin-protein ligase UPL4 [Zea mays]
MDMYASGAMLQYAMATIADEAADAGDAAAALAALCEVLAVSGSASILATPHAGLATRLPALLAGGSGSQGDDVPLLAARAIAEACDTAAQWASHFARHGAVEALCDRLLADDCVELAEECLRALNAISLECPHECLSRGVAAAVLQFFDFFSTSKKIVALEILLNIFSDYDEVNAPKAMEAVPALCNLLQNSDTMILESVVSCLVSVADGACENDKYMSKLICETNVVKATLTLMYNEGWKSLSDATLKGILRLFRGLASFSAKAVKSLFELNFCVLLEQMISYYSYVHHDSDKVQMLLELIYQLMPPLETSGQHLKLVTAKKKIIMRQRRYMTQLASIFALLVQVAKSAALSSICYSCVVVIGSFVKLCTPNLLVELQKTVNLSSLFNCLLAQKNQHVLFETLKISRILAKKDQHFFLESFTKEGVKHAIEYIVSQSKNNSHQNMKEYCLCFYMETSSTVEACSIANNSVTELAKEIKKNFLSVKGSNKSPNRFGFTLKSVRDFFARLNLYSSTHLAENPDSCKQLSDLSRRLLSDELPVTSNFEFVQSGSIKCLSVYLSNGAYCNADLNDGPVLEQLSVVHSRLHKFANLALTPFNESSANPLGILVEKLLDTLHMCYGSFPVLLSYEQMSREDMTMIPLRYPEAKKPTSLLLKFHRSQKERELYNYNGVLIVDLFSTPDSTEPILFPEVFRRTDQEPASENSNQDKNDDDGNKSSRLEFFYNGVTLQPSVTFFESILHLMYKGQSDLWIDPSFWVQEHSITYRKRIKSNKEISSQSSYYTRLSYVHEILQRAWLKDPFFTAILNGKLPGNLDVSDLSYNLLFMLKVLEGVNRFSYQLLMDEQINKFAEGIQEDINDIEVAICPVPRHQFLSSLLINKLEVQMQDVLFDDGLIPSWCVYLVENCPFLLSLDTRWKYFCLTVHRSFFPDQINRYYPQTKKYRVARSAIIEGAVSVMTNHGPSNRIIEVEFEGEIGTGRGPTFEFYSTVSHELQRAGLGMWRGDSGEHGFVHAPFGLFPKPWPPSSQGIDFTNMLQKFKLLGNLVVRAVLDGRILDIPLSKAFYKIMLEQELDMYDILSFDPELGRTVIEFQALVSRKNFLETSSEESNPTADLSYKNVKLEDLCLDFTLPGNPEYELVPGGSEKMVTLDSLDQYVSLVVYATLKSGIAKQIEAFKSGINEVFDLKALKMFTEEEMERILCGEQGAWDLKNLEDHIVFEHGYDMSSQPVIIFLEILREFGREEQRAFTQFSTGAPHLPLGGLASLDPKLTVVRKVC